MRSIALSPPFALARAAVCALSSLCLAAACTFEVAVPPAHAPSPACVDEERVLNVGAVWGWDWALLSWEVKTPDR